MGLRFGLGLEVGEDEADTADNEFCGGTGRWDGEEGDGKRAGVRAENEVVLVEVDEAEKERGAETDGVGGGLVGAVGGKRGVVAVEDDDGALGEEGGHGGGLLGIDADGDEAVPVFAGGGGAGAVFKEARGGEGNAFDDSRRGDFGLLDGDGGGNEGDGLGWVRREGSGGSEVERKDLLDGEFLSGEDTV